MAEHRIRVDTGLMDKILRLTEGTNAKTITERLRHLISEVEESRKPKAGYCKGVTKGEMIDILNDLKGGY